MVWGNFCSVSFKNLVKYKSLTLINVSGMAMALIACMLIGLYVFDEWSVDKALPNSGRIVRVSTKALDMRWAGTPAPISQAIAKDFPEVEASARIMKFPELDQMLLRFKGGEDLVQYYESGGFYADSTLFSVIEFPMIKGSPHHALHDPSSIVLSSGLARKIFGEKDPLHQTLTLGLPFGDFDYTVTGVFDEHALNTHLDPNFLLAMENQDFGNVVKNWTNWASNNIFYTYAKLQPETNIPHFESKLQEYYLNKAGADMKALGIHKTVFVQPFRNIYLHSNIDFELGKTGNATTLYVFVSIGLFILLIACINFMNLTTARSEKRAREVGIRKLLGASRLGLVLQFLFESIATSLIGFFLAAVVITVLIPNLDTLIGITIHSQANWVPWIFLLFICVGAGILAGIYPALFLSGFKPIAVLKGRFKGRISGVSFRKVLVVIQFCISACLILMVFVIKDQLNFLQDQDLGFDQEQQLIVRLRSEKAVENFGTLKSQLLQHPQINAVSIASTYPGVESLEDMMYYAEGKSVDEAVHIRNSYVGDDFIETLGFELIEGKSFTSELTSELPMIILNENAVRSLGYSVETAVGKKIHYDWIDQKHTLEIVGVVRDFHSQSLHRPIDPFGFRNGNQGGHLIANFNSDNPAEIIKLAKNIWEATGIVEPFTYSFLDQDFLRNYEKEARVSKIIISFALLALCIACLGLYGLASFMTEQRTKEIGIRKTLGATNWNIIRLMSGDFGKTVLLAILLSIPLSVFLANQWLANFAFRIDLHWSYFTLAGLLALLIAMITVSFQSIKAALMNPVESLRSE